MINRKLLKPIRKIHQMACFLACFGFSKKQKRRRISTKILSSDCSDSKKRIRAEYEPITITRRSIASDSEPRDKPKEKQISKVRKKVSFNLNVRAYEPLPKEPEIEEEIEQELVSQSSYPSNHRYQNYNGSNDEEDDDIQLDESDLDDCDDDLDEEYDYGYDDNTKLSQLDYSKDETCNVRERERSRYVCSVLNPIENMSQWREIKERETLIFKNRRKENFPPLQVSSSLMVGSDKVPLISSPSFRLSEEIMQENAVTISLSRWVSPHEIAARSTSCSLQEKSVCVGKSNLYNSICEIDEQMKYKSRINKGVA